MINKRIIPVVPVSGSLGASGDLAQLARLGCAMMGLKTTMVKYQGQIVSSEFALEREHINKFVPKSKEGLALTNGTTFMASILCVALKRQKEVFEQVMLTTCLFLDSIKAVDSAFFSCINQLRNQDGQVQIAKQINKMLQNSSFSDKFETQNDYCIRCIPQIYGPKLEQIQQSEKIILNEINAVTDNPLIFKNEEISPDVDENRIIHIGNDKWAILSGGNFHGECLSQTADILRICNAKMYLNIDRQSSYIMNNLRNKVLPIYLMPSEPGLKSGFMICHYTINSLAQQMVHMSNSMSTNNLTSGNESEDIVSYGHSSALALYNQLNLAMQANCIFTLICSQAYSIQKQYYLDQKQKRIQDCVSERLFQYITQELEKHNVFLPILEDISFDQLYQIMNLIVQKDEFRKIYQIDIFQQDDFEKKVQKKIKKK